MPASWRSQPEALDSVVYPLYKTGMRYIAFCLALSCVAAASTARAQSLADIAKAEQARRANITLPAKVYTDKDLVSERDLAGPAQPAPAAAVTPTPIEILTSIKPAPKDEGYWKDRMRVLQAQLDADQTFEREAAERERRLSEQAQRGAAHARFTPSEREQLSGMTRAWQDAFAEVGRLRAAILNDKRAIVSLQEEARRAGVLPGWLLP